MNLSPGSTPKKPDAPASSPPGPRAGGHQSAPHPRQKWLVAGLCLLLAAFVWAVFGQTLRHEFINLDDNEYVYATPEVTQGLTLKGIVWAFAHPHSGNWHPLTTVSHMLDCGVFGLKAGGHHLTNVLLHTAAAILLFLALRQLTSSLWRSAFVAALFAIHPLRVESVAWVAERKDVLSGLFFMATLWAYARYAQLKAQSSKLKAQGKHQPPNPAQARWRWKALNLELPLSLKFWALSLLCFAFGLMSKPSLVTLPFVLLLLDYWPLRRAERDKARVTGATLGNTRPVARLVLEKIPLFGLCLAVSVVTLMVQEDAIQALNTLSWPWRVANAAVSYLTYLTQMIYPEKLLPFYPHPTHDLPFRQIVVAFALLIAISAVAFGLRRNRPYLLVGWLWYLGVLVPMIGLVQVGGQAHADRYTYLAQIGCFVMLVWGIADLAAASKFRRWFCGGLGVAAILTLAVAAARQTAHWRNNESLWKHTLSVSPRNKVAHNHLGATLFEQGRTAEAIAHFRDAVEISPHYADAHFNLGLAWLKSGRTNDALAQFQNTVEINPHHLGARISLALTHLATGQMESGIAQCRKILELAPDQTDTRYNLGLALLKSGHADEAAVHFQTALASQPGHAGAHYHLATILVDRTEAQIVADGIEHFRTAVELKPEWVDALNNFAWELATQPDARHRDGQLAVQLAGRAVALTRTNYPAALDTLAAAYAEAGRFADAAILARQAIGLAKSSGDPDLAEAFAARLRLYEKSQPFRKSAGR